MLPCNFLPHDKFWPLLGKSCCKHCDQCGILATNLHAIWLSTLVQCNGLIICRFPFHAGCVIYHHHIIIMDIDDDIMLIVNNQPGLSLPWSASIRLVGLMVWPNGWEEHQKDAHPTLNKSWAFRGGVLQSTVAIDFTACKISLFCNSDIHSFE